MTHPPYWNPKGLIEHLCQQQAYAPDQHSKHVIQLALNMLATHRPVGPDGKHGDRHTPTCGCADTQDEITTWTRLRNEWANLSRPNLTENPRALNPHLTWGSRQQFEASLHQIEVHELSVDDKPVGAVWHWYGQPEPTVGVVKDDLWIPPDGQARRWNGQEWEEL